MIRILNKLNVFNLAMINHEYLISYQKHMHKTEKSATAIKNLTDTFTDAGEFSTFSK